MARRLFSEASAEEQGAEMVGEAVTEPRLAPKKKKKTAAQLLEEKAFS